MTIHFISSSVHLHKLVFFLEADATMSRRVPVLRLPSPVAATVGPTTTAVETRTELKITLRAQAGVARESLPC